jgi:Subtilase family
VASRPALTFNIAAGEVLQPESTIELSASRPIEARSAQGAIRLLRGCAPVRAELELLKRGRAAVVRTEPLDPGGYVLTVSELLDEKGERLARRLEIPFSVAPITGKLPRERRVEHAVRLQIGELDVTRLDPGERPEAGWIDVVKTAHRKTGEAEELAFDERGERVDAGKLLADVGRRRAKRYGKAHATLWERLEQADDGERIDIVVWPRFVVEPAPFEKPTDRRLEAPPKEEVAVARKLDRASKSMVESLRRAGVKLPARRKSLDDGVPAMHVSATPDQIRKLARMPSVGAVLLDDPTAIVDLGDSIAVAHSDSAHASGFDGTGIRVAVWESGPSVTTNLVFAGRFSTSPPASDHARLTSAIVKNTEAGMPHGHAPDCDLYSANSSDVAALRWAVRDQHVTVVSQSFHRSTEPSGSGLQADDLLKDWLALRWPYPTILQAAGNFWATDPDGISPPEDEFVNHKGFNSLAVGNHDDTAAAMSGDSVFRNPASTHGDRELPELAANGTGVSANGQTKSGTSFAAPAAAGVTALLQDVDGVLCSWPEGCRAILLASAGRNVSGSTWWQDVISRSDASDGAGAVDAASGVAIAQSRRWRDAPATRRGWDVGTLSSSVVGPDRLATFRYRVQVPSLLLLPKVKVALAWDSAVTTASSGDTATASTLTVDLDLLVRDSHGSQVAAAASWDNSYEVAEFSATPGETYEIVIRRWSGTDSVWYGVAWTVTGLWWWFPFVSASLIESFSP